MRLTTRDFDRTGRPLRFTELGFGSSPLGNLYRAISEEEAQALLERAWAGGIRYFDTAPLYGYGLAEERLGRFLAGHPRSDYVLSTKVGRLLRPVEPGEARDGLGKFFEVPERKERFDYGYDGVMRSLEASLDRLGLDRVDVLYAHDLDLFTHGSQGGAGGTARGIHGRRLPGAGRAARSGRDLGLRRGGERVAALPVARRAGRVRPLPPWPAATRFWSRRRSRASCPWPKSVASAS